MIKPTASQQTAINEKRYQHFVRFTLDPLTTLTIGEDEIWEGGFKVDQAVSGRSAFELGACVVNQLKVEIYNPNGTYQNTDFLGKPVYAYIELYDTDNTTVIGTISKGHYIVTEADTNGQIVKLTCLDAMSTLDRPYTDVNTVYPATLYNIVNDIATLAGLTLSLDGVNWLPTGITSAYTVTVRPTDVNCRDVLSAVCQATGNYATIDRLGQLLITRYDTAFIAETGSDYSGYDYNEVDPSNLFSLTRDEAQVTLTGVSVEVGEDAYTAGTDDYMIYIVDNPVINAGSEQTFATALNTLVNGWNFRPFEADTRSNMCMEAGDNVVITDTLGNVYKSIVTHVEYEAGNKQNAECNADPAAVQSSKRYSEAAKAASQTVKVYDSTVNNYIDLVSKGLGMYRSLITDPDDPTQQIYAFHNDETIGDSTFCMFENSNDIQVGRRDTTSDPWVYTSADVEDAVVLAQTLVANTAIINALFSNDVTVTGALHSSDYVAASPGASPPYSQAGMGLDFGEKEFEAEHFAIDALGRMWASEGMIADWHIVNGWFRGEGVLYYTAAEKAAYEAEYRQYFPDWNCPDTYGIRVGLYPTGYKYDEETWSDWVVNEGTVIGIHTQKYFYLPGGGEGGPPEQIWTNVFSVDIEGKMYSSDHFLDGYSSADRFYAITPFKKAAPSFTSDNLQYIAKCASGNVGMRAKRTDSTGDVCFGVGSQGVNHGVYSVTLGRWMLYGDASSAYFNGRVNTENTAGFLMDVYGNLQHARSTNTDNWNIKNNAGTNKFSVNYETGEITTATPLAISQGGTGATTRLNAFKNLTNQGVGSSATHFVTLTTNWATAGYSNIADSCAALGIKCTRLWNGTLTSGSITFTYGGYNAYIVMGKASASSLGSVTIPAPSIGTSDSQWQIADDSSYIVFKIKYSGSTGTVTFVSRQTGSSAQVNYVYGIK